MNSQELVLYPAPARASGSAVASQSLTVSTAAVAFATAYDAVSVQFVTFDVQDNTVRVRWDGTDPTSTVGHILYAGQPYTWSTSMFNAAKFIRISTASADAIIFASPLAR
jgi:hypothetical protein